MGSMCSGSSGTADEIRLSFIFSATTFADKSAGLIYGTYVMLVTSNKMHSFTELELLRRRLLITKSKLDSFTNGKTEVGKEIRLVRILAIWHLALSIESQTKKVSVVLHGTMLETYLPSASSQPTNLTKVLSKWRTNSSHSGFNSVLDRRAQPDILINRSHYN